MNDESTLLQAALDVPELAAYYHETDAPDRVPLRLHCREAYCAGLSLQKFGVPVEVMSDVPGDLPVMVVQNVSIDGATAKVSLSYPIEGVRADVAFVRESGAWKVESSDVVEQ